MKASYRTNLAIAFVHRPLTLPIQTNYPALAEIANANHYNSNSLFYAAIHTLSEPQNTTSVAS
jgi:hypothetical protein